MYCRYCGKQIGEQVRFCRYCGKEIIPAQHGRNEEMQTAGIDGREQKKEQAERTCRVEQEKERTEGKRRAEQEREQEEGKRREEQAGEWEPFVVEMPVQHKAGEQKPAGKRLRVVYICAAVLLCCGLGLWLLAGHGRDLSGLEGQVQEQPVVVQKAMPDMDYAAALQTVQERFQEYLPSAENTARFEDCKMQLQTGISNEDWQACKNVYEKLSETEANVRNESIVEIERLKADLANKLDDGMDEDLEVLARQEISEAQSQMEAAHYVSAKAHLEAGEHFYAMSETDDREEFSLDLAQVDVSRYPTVR